MNDLETFTLYKQHINHVISLHERLFEKQQFNQLVISSGALKRQFNDDMDYPFKINPYFKY